MLEKLHHQLPLKQCTKVGLPYCFAFNSFLEEQWLELAEIIREDSSSWRCLCLWHKLTVANSYYVEMQFCFQTSLLESRGNDKQRFLQIPETLSQAIMQPFDTLVRLVESRLHCAGNKTLSLDGGLAVAIPLELKGLWTAHQRYTLLPALNLTGGHSQQIASLSWPYVPFTRPCFARTWLSSLRLLFLKVESK